MNKRFLTAVLVILNYLPLFCFAQQPRHTPKAFVNYVDTVEFKVSRGDTGYHQTFILSHIAIWDVDDDNRTHVTFQDSILINIAGNYKNGKRNGIFTTYAIAQSDHKKKFRLYEQDYADDQLDGQWRIYNLKGTLIGFDSFEKGKPAGISRRYFIDGKRIIEESELVRNSPVRLARYYGPDNRLQRELSLIDTALNGFCREFYEDGTLMRSAWFRNNLLDGNFKYYYPNGKLWIEQEYKEGKQWTVLGNYTSDGKRRDAGTLKNGNGTVILYNEDGTVREVVKVLNGVEMK